MDIEVGVFPFALSRGDFDGDRNLDLAVLNFGPSSAEDPAGSVSCLRGSPNDGLSKNRLAEIRVGARPSAMVNADFDADGIADLAVANGDGSVENPASVTYLRGARGTGLSRSTGPDFVFAGSPIALAAGDFDGDGVLDLAVINAFGFSEDPSVGSVVVLPGKESMGLSSEGKIEIPVGFFARAVTTGDFDGDGILDLVVANADSFTVSYLRWRREGDNVEVETSDLGVGESPAALAAADYDGDGALDLVVMNQTSGTITYFSGGPDGLTETRKHTLRVGEEPTAIASGDFNGDASLDIAVSNSGSDTVSGFFSRYVVAHVNCPGDTADPGACSLVDPARPARYRVEVAANGIGITAFPMTVFAIPQAGIARTVISDAVTIRSSAKEIDGKIEGEAYLTLRVRAQELKLLDGLENHSSRLRVFRQNPETGIGVELSVAAEIVDFRDGSIDGKGIRFRLEAVGSYLCALERAN